MRVESNRKVLLQDNRVRQRCEMTWDIEGRQGPPRDVNVEMAHVIENRQVNEEVDNGHCGVFAAGHDRVSGGQWWVLI